MEAQSVNLTRWVAGVTLAQARVQVYCADAEELEAACEDEADKLYEEYAGLLITVSGSLAYPSRGGKQYGTVSVRIEARRNAL